MKTKNVPLKKEVDAFVASLMPDSDKKMASIAGVSVLVAVALGFWAAAYERLVPDVIFEVSARDEVSATLDITEKKVEKKEEKKMQKNKKQKKEDLRKTAGAGGKPKGHGKPHAALNRGVLKLLTVMTKNPMASAYTFTKERTAKDIDKILHNTNGLQTTGKTKIGGIRGKVDGAFNEGIAAGGSGGLEDAITNLFAGSGGPSTPKSMKGGVLTPKVRDIDVGSGSSSRSASDIMKVVRTRTPGLRHIYNKFLKKNPGFDGKVTLRFTIAPGGEIITISVVSSTTGYAEFDESIRKTVAGWTFSKVKSGNTTVTIPFSFSE